ncbi:hypothetical protein ACOME3_009337 [Neoechinorhynchus agilis]
MRRVPDAQDWTTARAYPFDAVRKRAFPMRSRTDWEEAGGRVLAVDKKERPAIKMRKVELRNDKPMYLQPSLNSSLRSSTSAGARNVFGIGIDSAIFEYDAISKKLLIDVQMSKAYDDFTSGGRHLSTTLDTFVQRSNDDKRRLMLAWLYDVLNSNNKGSLGDGKLDDIVKRIGSFGVHKEYILDVMKDLTSRYYRQLLTVVKDRLLRAIDKCFTADSGIRSYDMIIGLLRHVRSGDSSQLNLHLTSHVIYMLNRHYPEIKRRPIVVSSSLYAITRIAYDHFMCQIEASSGKTTTVVDPTKLKPSQFPLPVPDGGNETKAANRELLDFVLQKEIGFCCRVLRDDIKYAKLIGRDYIRILQPLLKIGKFRRFWCSLLNKKEDLRAILSTPTDPFYIITRIPCEIERDCFFMCVETRFASTQIEFHLRWIDRYIKKVPGGTSSSLKVDIIRYLVYVLGSVSTLAHIKQPQDAQARERLIDGLLTSVQCPFIAYQCRLAIYFDLILPLAHPLQNHLAAIECGFTLAAQIPQFTNCYRNACALVDFLARQCDIFAPFNEWFIANARRSLEVLLLFGRTDERVLSVLRQKVTKALKFISGDSMSTYFVSNGYLSLKDRVLRSNFFRIFSTLVTDQFTIRTLWHKNLSNSRKPVSMDDNTKDTLEDGELVDSWSPSPDKLIKKILEKMLRNLNEDSSNLNSVFTSYLIEISKMRNSLHLVEKVHFIVHNFINDALIDFRIHPLECRLWSARACNLVRTRTFDQNSIFAPIRALLSIDDVNNQVVLLKIIKLVHNKQSKYASLVLLALSVISAEEREVLEKIYSEFEKDVPICSSIKKHLLSSEWHLHLFFFLLPYVMVTYPTLRGDYDIISMACKYLSDRRLTDYTMAHIFDTFTLFSQDSIKTNVIKSQQMSLHAQDVFWHLLGASTQAVPPSTYLEVFTNSISNNIDSHITLILKRQCQPTEQMIGMVLRRKPDNFSEAVIDGWCRNLKNEGKHLNDIANIFIAAARAINDPEALAKHLKGRKDQYLLTSENLVNFLDTRAPPL